MLQLIVGRDGALVEVDFHLPAVSAPDAFVECFNKAAHGSGVGYEDEFVFLK